MASFMDETLEPGNLDGLVAQRMDDWRRRLIDLSYRNRLIKYRALQVSTVAISAPSVDVLLADLTRSSPWSFYFPPEPPEKSADDEGTASESLVDEAVLARAQQERPPKKDEIVTTERLPKRLARVLDNLAKKSNAEFQDKGLRVLYLAAGFLDWIDPGRDERLSSPLVLVPVRLHRESASQPYRLYFVDDEETVINPSLAEKLRHDASLELPDEFFWEDKPILTELQEIADAVAPHGWTVRNDVVLGLFSFQKYVMYRDLLDHEDFVVKHPLVRSLASQRLLPEAATEIDLPTADELDDEQPAATSFSILDADASQRMCIEAAKRGLSFVMHGPPGTGKSQTIANIVSEAISDGKRVLFVSEKAAALDVVHNRLRQRGLSEYCLMLHGEHASRREVVAALNASLTTALQPRLTMEEGELSRHDQLRQYLNEQIAALHDPDPLLGDQSIRAICSMLATLQDAPLIPGSPPASRCESKAVNDEAAQLHDVFNRLAERWQVSGPDYAWREFDASRFSSDDRARVSRTIEHLAVAARTALQAGEIAADGLGWPRPTSVDEAERLIEICEHLRTAPAIQGHWLDPDHPQRIRDAAAAARAAYERLNEQDAKFTTMYVGRTLDDFDPGIADAVERVLRVAGDATGRTDSWNPGLLQALPGLIDAVRDLASRCDLAERRVRELGEQLGQVDQDPSFSRIDELVRLANLCFDPPARPEPDWLAQAGLNRAVDALDQAAPLIDEYQRRRQVLLEEWTESAFSLDGARLAARYTELEAARATLLKMWRQDALTLDVPTVQAELARNRQERADLLETWTEDALATPQSELHRRFATDYTSAFSKLKGDYRRDSRLVKELRRDGRMPEDPASELERIVNWQRQEQGVAETLSSASVTEQMPEDVDSRLADLLAYQLGAREAGAVVAPHRIDRGIPAQPDRALQALADAQALAASIEQHAPRWSVAFGSRWQGPDTEVSELRSACDAAAEALTLRHPNTELSVLIGRLCVGSSPDPQLAQTADQVTSALHELRSQLRVLAKFVHMAELSDDHATVRKTRHVADTIRQPLENLQLVVAEVQRGAVEPCTTLDQLTTRAELISSLHRVASEIRQSESEWAKVIGPPFSGAQTDWALLETAADWTDALYRLAPVLTSRITGGLLDAEPMRWPDPSPIGERLDTYEQAAQAVMDLFAEPRRTELSAELSATPLDEIETITNELLASVDTLFDWTDFRHYRDRARESGWGAFVDHLVEEDVRGDLVPDAFLQAYWNRRLDALFNDEPELEEDLRGGSYERFIRDFRELDRRLVKTGPDRLISRRNTLASPHIAFGNSEVSVLKAEAGKLRRHMPVRRLLAAIPTLLGDLKPCLMMSPLSVSHFLTTQHQFDLVLFDEASQVPPQDAINCVYRGKQLIVAGDSRQLPPTSFFQVGELDGIDDDDPQEDMESVLDSCTALLPEFKLSWHYRSRNEDLISFSNQHIYDDELITFPTPDHLSAEMGVSVTFVPDGVYDRGRSQTNPIEARVVAERLVSCLRDASGRSVGVIAFNSAQAAAIQTELDVLRVQHPELEPFFGGDRLDGPFVKHLESVQGDERDVILFSLGYARDAEGKFPMTFGPLNKAGGHRRLNVAITRARQKVEVVTSVRSTDFSLGDKASRGARLLRDYLAYVERSGSETDLDVLGDNEHFAVTGLEREVAREIERLGFRAIHQVGAGAMRIDVAVVDPERPDEFVLGIETDGPLYRGIATTRDRDRLRDEVLRQLGWRIHRIWCLDWLRNRNAEIERLEQSLTQPESRDEDATEDDTTDVGVATVDRIERVVVDIRDPDTLLHLPWVTPYEREELPFQYSTFEFHEPQNREKQARLAATLLHCEAPIHIDHAAKRLAEAYGLQRVGHRVEAAAHQALASAAREHGFSKSRGFYSADDAPLTAVRRPVPGDPRTKREIEMIPPQEIDLAFRRLIETAAGASNEDLTVAVARILGFERTGERVRDVLTRRLKRVRAGLASES